MKNLQRALLTLMTVCLSSSVIAPDCLAKHSDAKKGENQEEQIAPKSIDSVDALSRWMTYYYVHPQPDLIVSALLFADKQGLLTGDATAPMQAFTSKVFAQNPEKLKDWFSQLGSLSENGKTLIITAIWWSGSKEGKELLDSITTNLPEKPKAEFKKQIEKSPPELEKMEIESPDVLDMLWACFSATGDEKYVKRLLNVLTWSSSDSKDLPKMLIVSAARWSLLSNLDQHAKVKEICESLKKQDADLKPYIEKLLEEHAAKIAQEKQAAADAAAKAAKEAKEKKEGKSSRSKQELADTVSADSKTSSNPESSSK